MSSPPPPPPPLQYPQTNPLKRPSLTDSSSQPLLPNPKRPRNHPLRQTSFPAPCTDHFSLSATSDAGSVTGSFTGSLGGASADGVFQNASRMKKRGRKSKAEREGTLSIYSNARSSGLETRAGSVDGDHLAAASTGTGAGTVSARSGHLGQAGDEEGDDDDLEDEGELLGGEERVTDVEAEKKNLALLVDAFNPMQSERYDLFKRTKLRKESLRRIVNHALSQSVPAGVVTTVNGFTKVFIGQIVEKARTVQAEWAEAYDQAARAAFETEEQQAKNDPVETKSSQGQPVVRQEREFKPPPNPHRGQLLPSHLREAQRRYRRDCDGGGVGFAGLSMGNLGVRGSFVWNTGSVGGQRIFH